MTNDKTTVFYRGDENRAGQDDNFKTVQSAIDAEWFDVEFDVVTIIHTMCGNFSMSESFTGVETHHIEDFLTENFQDDMDAGQLGFDQITSAEYFEQYAEYKAVK